MKHGLLLTRSYLHLRGLAIAVTWFLLLTLYGLSGAVTSAQAQTRAYVANQCSGTVAVIDAATNTLVTTIPVGSLPFAIAITPDGARAYVSNVGSSSISVIDTATNTVIATVTEGVSCPIGVAITPAPLAPTSKDDCKNGGFRRFGPPAGPFRNQGQCVSYVNRHSP